MTKFRHSQPTYDWNDSGFGAAFAVYIFLTVGFQLNYMFLYFIIHNLAENEQEIIRYSALLRGTESAWQALSYGLTSITIFAQVGGVYINFGLWAVSLAPAWLVVRHFGYRLDGVVESSPESESGSDVAQPVLSQEPVKTD